jgi:hypothetical protein
MATSDARHDATSEISLEQLTAEIRDTYIADGDNVTERVEQRLREKLVDCSDAQRCAFLDRLITVFRHDPTADDLDPQMSGNEFDNLLTMLLGREILEKKLPPEEMIKQLAVAVNTVFDSVNTLIGGINATLMGSAGGEETIRVVIRSSLDTNEGLVALKKFLDQTGEFFAIALQAYKEAAQVKIKEILDELNPERLEEECGGKMKFGPLHKAHLYDCYLEKYKTLQNWQRSGLLLEAFLREFEKNCQNLYSRTVSQDNKKHLT